MATTITRYPATATLISGSTNGQRYKNCVGKGSATTASGNDYASGDTATVRYTFDFTDIPAGATIESVEVKVGGHAESATYNTQRRCEFQLYSGNTAKGAMANFSKTSKQVITMEPGTWTRDELQDAQLRMTLGYYGGIINGVDFTVAYTEGTSGPTCWMQVNGQIRAISKIWKQENGRISEVQPSELDRDVNYHLET